MIQSGFEQLKTEKRSGVSMAIVLCLSAFFLAFAAAILYTTGALSKQSAQRMEQERCYQLSKSYSDVLQEELERYSRKEEAPTSSFYAFANQFIDDQQYLEYDSALPEITRYRYMTSGTGDILNPEVTNTLEAEYGNLMITLQKEKNTEESASDLSGMIDRMPDAGEYNKLLDEIRNRKFRQYMFTVLVTAYYGNEEYTCSTEYVREEVYHVKFMQDENPIVWDGMQWHEKEVNGEVYDPDMMNEKIQYEYDTNQPVSCYFFENISLDEGE